jgi:hypothetical protein
MFGSDSSFFAEMFLTLDRHSNVGCGVQRCGRRHRKVTNDNAASWTESLMATCR